MTSVDVYRQLLPFLHQPQQLTFARVSRDVTINLTSISSCHHNTVNFDCGLALHIGDEEAMNRLDNYLDKNPLSLPTVSTVFLNLTGIGSTVQGLRINMN